MWVGAGSKMNNVGKTMGKKKILALTDPLLCNVGPHRLYMKDCPVSPIWVPRTKRFLQPTVVHVSTVVQATLRYCK